MKVTAETVTASEMEGRSAVSVYVDLFKARLTMLVLLTCMAGFYLGSAVGGVSLLLMFHTVMGTALLACGAAALNQYYERDLDSRMERTKTRPLPAGELTPGSVLLTGTILSAVGMLYLAFLVNAAASLIGAATLVSYVIIYTPLKRLTPFNTVVGAVPGALPPLLGWAAATGGFSIEGWGLFAILFFWQLPHFYAIAWIYREQYQDAGFSMLPSVDPTGQKSGAKAVSHTLGLLPLSLSPFVFGLTGWVYLAAAILLGVGYIVSAVKFKMELSEARARKLFLYSIIYLPLLLILMVADKLPA